VSILAGTTVTFPPSAFVPAATRVRDAMVTVPKTHATGTPVAAIRSLFEDDHVHMALIVVGLRLITTVERSDLDGRLSGSTCADQVGTLAGRTISPNRPLDEVTVLLKQAGRRRLAVVDGSGELLGLLCLKRDGTGYCSDQGVRERAAELRRNSSSAGDDLSPQSSRRSGR
jgi:CBS domain-containing protein